MLVLIKSSLNGKMVYATSYYVIVIKATFFFLEIAGISPKQMVKSRFHNIINWYSSCRHRTALSLVGRWCHLKMPTFHYNVLFEDTTNEV